MTPEELEEALARNAEERRALVAEHNRRHKEGEPMAASHFTGWAPDNLSHHLVFGHSGVASPEALRDARQAVYSGDPDALTRLHQQAHS